MIRISLKSDYLISILIISVGLLGFVFTVWADTATTSVSVGNAAPVISNLSFNSGTSLTLVENSYKWATSTMTVTDTNGCSGITSVTTKFYLASTSNNGTTCSANDNNCYVSTCSVVTSGNTCTGGADTSADYECGFKVWYNAEATDASAPVWATSIWSVAATSSDGSDTSTATNTAETIEVNTLTSLNVTSSISYPGVSAGGNSGATNQTVTITNTGNVAIDSEISGSNLCTDYPGCAGEVITVGNQKYDINNVTYASLTSTLSGTPSTLELDLAKPTATTSAITDLTYWGIAIPGGQAVGTYSGENTFSAVSD